MQLNVTTDYGLRVVLYLAQKKGAANSKEICDNMGIPQNYMHKIARTLKNAGVLGEIRGSNGGFKLKIAPDKLSVLTVVDAFERTMKINRCLEKDELCSRHATDTCPVRAFYIALQDRLNESLDIKISTFLVEKHVHN
ncbi:MAG: Rrf2 family transcriptional regulator [Candidatus Bathyarchaeota archaeon]|nr:Rrf2 family transcriptional regulator [Candidatus Termiticorpusculum sp.]